jgi:hypothetical protein
MKRLVLVLAFASLGGAAGRTQSSIASASALADFFKPGVVFQDRNNDGAVDFVNARIVLAENPTAGELAAAATVAARLGFETSAMNIPIARAGEAPAIFVGAKSLAGSGATADALGGAGLKAGDGLVAAFTASGQPSVAILGADEAGLAAAAVMLAGHLPYLWDQKSPATDKIADDVKQWLTAKSISVSSAIVPAIFVKSGGEGVDRLAVDVQTANGGDL